MLGRISVPIVLAMVTFLSGCSSTNVKWPRLTFESRDEDDTYATARRSLNNPDQVLGAYAEWKADVNELGEARRSYQTLLSGNPDNVNALLGMAKVEEKAGRLAQAEQKLLEAIQRNPKNAQAKSAAGQFYSRNNRAADAIELLSKALTEDPTNPTYRFDLGVALTKSGQISEGLSHLQMTVGEAEAQYNVGYLLNEMGQKQQAVPYLQKALAMKPGLTVASDLLASITQRQTNPTVAARRPTVPAIRPQQVAAQPQMASRPPVTSQPQVAAQPTIQQSGYRAPQPMTAQPVMPPVHNQQMNPQPVNSQQMPQQQSYQQPMQAPTVNSRQPSASPAMPGPQTYFRGATYNGPVPGGRGLPKINVTNRRQVQQTIQQASGYSAAPASTGLTPDQLKKLVNAMP